MHALGVPFVSWSFLASNGGDPYFVSWPEYRIQDYVLAPLGLGNWHLVQIESPCSPLLLHAYSTSFYGLPVLFWWPLGGLRLLDRAYTLQSLTSRVLRCSH
jgi:hypothetical protein